MGKSFDPIGLAGKMRDAELLNSTPRPIVSMSFQLAIPWRVALPQSPPPLHQPGAIMHERTAAGHQKPANGQLCLNYLSHPRGQVHGEGFAWDCHHRQIPDVQHLDFDLPGTRISGRFPLRATIALHLERQSF